MKKYALFLLLLLSCTSSEPETVELGRKTYMRYLHKVLKDPNSLVIYSEKYNYDKDDERVYWTVDYGAKNSFGGMVREKTEFMTTFGGIYLTVNGESVSSILYGD